MTIKENELKNLSIKELYKLLDQIIYKIAKKENTDIENTLNELINDKYYFLDNQIGLYINNIYYNSIIEIAKKDYNLNIDKNYNDLINFTKKE